MATVSSVLLPTATAWASSHVGTNGYVSSWGAMLSGTTPTSGAA